MTNLTIILACLSMIESGDNDKAIGAAGERSRWQITQEVWEYNDAWRFDFKIHAKDKVVARGVAEVIVETRWKAFKTLFHRDPTPFETYVLWNAPAQIGHPSKVVAERAQRFENLVRKMGKEKK